MKWLIPDWRDIVAVLGAGSVIYGVWLIYPPLAWIIGGLVVLWFVWSMG